MPIQLVANWRPVRFSPYDKGMIQSSNGDAAIFALHRHRHTGQIRVRSHYDLDGRTIQVNDLPPVVLHAKGWRGTLYIGD